MPARVILRPWRADAFLSETANVLVWQKQSITKLLEYSHVFMGWFQQYQDKMETSVTHSIRNVSYAKHHFDGASKPLGRMCLKLEAIVMTAIRVARERRGKVEGRKAEEFLAFLNTERVLTP